LNTHWLKVFAQPPNKSINACRTPFLIAFTRNPLQVHLVSVKCLTHKTDAVAICTYCGHGVCADCAKPTATGRTVCSDQCAASLTRADRAMELILQKSLQNTRASAFYSFLCAGLSAGGAIGAWYYLPVPFLVWFCGGCSVVFITSGIWYTRISRKQIS
jgi:predicted nucleic acid-binding Zn ribbon protein